MTALVFLAPLVPLMLASAALAGERGRAFACRSLPWATAPALLLALLPGMAAGTARWVLLDSLLVLDAIGRALLFLTAVLWLAASLYARAYHARDPRRGRFAGFFLLTMSGNFAVVIAADAATFYFAFALMTFAAYGLVVHAGTLEAFRAGRVYIVMAVVGEALLVAGLVIAASSAASYGLGDMAAGVATSPHRNAVMALLLAGFGIKAGALPLHVWLPLAHPVAPTPASAVLSGCMIKAGLLGWIRFLPLGLVALPSWGALVIVLGLTAAFAGVLLGVTQREPKTVLAYSSISQMGIINVGVGIALVVPHEWPVVLPAVVLYAVHHGFAKGALFLGVGVGPYAKRGTSARRLWLGGMGLAALALAGAPLTSGSIAKRYLKDVVQLTPGPWPYWLDVLLPLTGVATTVLMGALFVRLSRARHTDEAGPLPRPMLLGWGTALSAVALAIWLIPRVPPFGIEPPAFPYFQLIVDAAWPIALGLALVELTLLWSRHAGERWRVPEVQPGDIVLPVERAARTLALLHPERLLPRPVMPVAALVDRWYHIYARSDQADAVLRGELALTRWEIGAVLLIGVALALVLLLAGSGV
jgi:formate hydrogenlyase subunit 3/multisubunit Na+/H+ antiporter MnhD subunit